MMLMNQLQAGWPGCAPAQLGLLSTVGQSSVMKDLCVEERKEKKRKGQPDYLIFIIIAKMSKDMAKQGEPGELHNPEAIAHNNRAIFFWFVDLLTRD
jgi:hypothetical protein